VKWVSEASAESLLCYGKFQCMNGVASYGLPEREEVPSQDLGPSSETFVPIIMITCSRTCTGMVEHVLIKNN